MNVPKQIVNAIPIKIRYARRFFPWIVHPLRHSCLIYPLRHYSRGMADVFPWIVHPIRHSCLVYPLRHYSTAKRAHYTPLSADKVRLPHGNIQEPCEGLDISEAYQGYIIWYVRSPFSLLYSDLITLALPNRLKRVRTLSWYQPNVPIFRSLQGHRASQE